MAGIKHGYGNDGKPILPTARGPAGKRRQTRGGIPGFYQIIPAIGLIYAAVRRSRCSVTSGGQFSRTSTSDVPLPVEVYPTIPW